MKSLIAKLCLSAVFGSAAFTGVSILIDNQRELAALRTEKAERELEAVQKDFLERVARGDFPGMSIITNSDSSWRLTK